MIAPELRELIPLAKSMRCEFGGKTTFATPGPLDVTSVKVTRTAIEELPREPQKNAPSFDLPVHPPFCCAPPSRPQSLQGVGQNRPHQ